ncbi:hypothetical protein R6Q59_003324 [Mikania micrantha]
MIPLFSVDEPYPVYHKVYLDSFGEHVVHCKELPGFKYTHNLVRGVLCDVLKRANISAKKEAPMNLLTDVLEGRSTLRHANILVFGWEWGNTHVWTLRECPLLLAEGYGIRGGSSCVKGGVKKGC